MDGSFAGAVEVLEMRLEYRAKAKLLLEEQAFMQLLCETHYETYKAVMREEVRVMSFTIGKITVERLV